MIYHHDDGDAAADFVDEFGPLFERTYTRGVTDGDDFVDSPADDLILHSIRDRYVRDASLAILLLGETTWSRRFVDWEIAAVLSPRGAQPLPLMAVCLDRLPPRLPPRLLPTRHFEGQSPVARVASLPRSPVELSTDIACSLRNGRGRACLSAPPLLRSDLRI